MNWTPRMATTRTVHVLTSDWHFKQTDDDDDATWLPVARVPTNVHLDLLAHGKIPDPFLGFNELSCEWVADKAWTYRVALPSVAAAAAAQHGVRHVLAFDGLDTFATVRVDGHIVLQSDNMWRLHRVDVTDVLSGSGSEHVLEIEFASARLEGIRIKEAHPEHRWVGFNGDMARLAVRKAQYHW